MSRSAMKSAANIQDSFAARTATEGAAGLSGTHAVFAQSVVPIQDIEPLRSDAVLAMAPPNPALDCLRGWSVAVCRAQEAGEVGGLQVEDRGGVTQFAVPDLEVSCDGASLDAVGVGLTAAPSGLAPPSLPHRLNSLIGLAWSSNDTRPVL